MTSKLVKSDVYFPNGDNMTVHNKYKVTIEHKDNKIGYFYYCSQSDYLAGLNSLEGNNLLLAILTFFNEGLNIEGLSFEDFCKKYGDNINNIRSKTIYYSHLKQLGKLRMLGLNGDIGRKIVLELNRMGIK
jgi:hypothetical protein